MSYFFSDKYIPQDPRITIDVVRGSSIRKHIAFSEPHAQRILAVILQQEDSIYTATGDYANEITFDTGVVVRATTNIHALLCYSFPLTNRPERDVILSQDELERAVDHQRNAWARAVIKASKRRLGSAVYGDGLRCTSGQKFRRHRKRQMP